MKNPWNERAGTNRHSREARGEHIASPGYRPGDNWIVCQRCGFDIMASDAKEDGYREGLIVCPKCYDAPHPQDFVRAFDDLIAPLGFSTGASEYARTCTTGSTEVPFGTMRDAQDPTLGTVPDQTYESDDTITTIETGASDFGSYDDYRCLGDTIGPATYCVDQLPSGIVIEATTGDITGTVVEDPASEDGMQTIVCAVYDDGFTFYLSPFTWNLTTNLSLAPDEMAYIACDPAAANASNLQIWYDANDLTAQFVGTEWTGDNADEIGDTIRTGFNKAYPLASFPTRGTDATNDAAAGTSGPKVVGHDTAPSTNDFTGTATKAWGFETVTGGRTIIQGVPDLASGDHYKPCANKGTMIWVFESPESGNSTQQCLTDDHGSPGHNVGGKLLWFNPTTNKMQWEFFNSGSDRQTVELWTPRGGGLPRWEILLGRINEDNAVEEINFWRNGLHVATHASAFDPFTMMRSCYMGGLYPTPFSYRTWEPKFGELLFYDRWLTNDEANALLLYLSDKHGITIEGTVGFEGSES